MKRNCRSVMTYRKRPKDDIEKARAIVLEEILGSQRRLSALEVRKMLAKRFGFDHQTISTAIQSLVERNAVIYTNQFGCTFIEPSYNKPIHVTDRIVLKPPFVIYPSRKGETVVNIGSGAAFGNGAHPTTRLALRGVAHVMECRLIEKGADAQLLDIGTGTGILAVAALLMGIGNALCSDVDPCARSETARNAALNGLSERVQIVGLLEELPSDRFSLVTANLRPPTLLALKPFIVGSLRDKGAIVLSGIKQEDRSVIKNNYAEGRLTCRWEETEKGWAVLVFSR